MRRVAAVLVIALMVASIAISAGTSVTQGNEQSVAVVDQEPSPMNFTVTWWGDGKGNPQAPGAENVTMLLLARGFPVDLTPIGNATIATPSGQGARCGGLE